MGSFEDQVDWIDRVNGEKKMIDGFVPVKRRWMRQQRVSESKKEFRPVLPMPACVADEA